MAALAYLLPPISGFVVYLKGRDERARRHGLQSVLFGAAWPALLYLVAFIGPGATQVMFFGGIALWLSLLIATAVGRDPIALPLRAVLERAGATSPLDRAAKDER